MDVLNGRRLPTIWYPFRGFTHFMHHPTAHAGPIFRSILKVVASSIVTVVPIFKYGYTGQLCILYEGYRILFARHKPVPTAAFLLLTATTSFLCLIESSIVTAQLSNYFIGNIRRRLFDSVLIEQGQFPDSTSDLQAIAAELAGPASPDPEPLSLMSPTSIMVTCSQYDDTWKIDLLRYSVLIMTLPLNIVPVLGPICFVSIQALFRAGSAHQRYFQLYGWSMAQRRRRIEANFWQYHRFGLFASALEMIPFVGYVFMYTNEVGAALWALDLHLRPLRVSEEAKKQ